MIVGTFNNSIFKATTSGYLDTSGESFNHFELAFTEPPPPNFNPILAGYCYASSYNCVALLPIAATSKIKPQNLMELSTGSYTSSRKVRFETLGSENFVEFKSKVSIGNGVISTTDSTINGMYDGPIDLLGVIDCHQRWKNGPDKSTVLIQTKAKIARANGENLPIEITTTYGGLANKLDNDTQDARIIYGNQMWNGRILSFDSFGFIHA